MLIKIGGETRYLDSEMIATRMSEAYDKHSSFLIKLPNGAELDFRKGGLARIVMSQFLMRIIIPLLSSAYTMLNKEMPAKPKHGDIIDYAAECYIGLFAISTQNAIFELIEEPYMPDLNQIVDVKLSREQTIADDIRSIIPISSQD